MLFAGGLQARHPFNTPVKQALNTFSRFYADPAKYFSQHSLRVLKHPSEIPNTLKRFSSYLWEISAPPKGSKKTSPPPLILFPAIFFQTVSIFCIIYKGSWENLEKIIFEKAYFLTKYSTLAHNIFFLSVKIKLKDRQKSSIFLHQASHRKMALNLSGFSTDPWGIKR
jgi:hypothetical protein